MLMSLLSADASSVLSIFLSKNCVSQNLSCSGTTRRWPAPSWKHFAAHKPNMSRTATNP